MRFEIDNYHPHEIIKKFASKSQVNSRRDCLEECFELSKDMGSGKVVGFRFSDGVSLLVFDCTLVEDWEILMYSNKPAPLLFNFNISGEVWHSFNENYIHYHLNPLQGSITSAPGQIEQIYKLPGQEKLLFAILTIDRALYLKKIDCILEKMPINLQGLFEDVKSNRPFFYQGNYSIAASELIKKIIDDQHTGLVRSAYIEGKALELLARQVKQYKDDLRAPSKQAIFRKYDVDKIVEARNILIKDLKNPPTIVELSKKSGINQQKLKVGFKTIFETTINKYLRKERLERASIFLLQGYSVRETAHSVGYENQSHFAARFREKYGVLPKDYLKSIRERDQY